MTAASQAAFAHDATASHGHHDTIHNFEDIACQGIMSDEPAKMGTLTKLRGTHERRCQARQIEDIQQEIRQTRQKDQMVETRVAPAEYKLSSFEDRLRRVAQSGAAVRGSRGSAPPSSQPTNGDDAGWQHRIAHLLRGRSPYGAGAGRKFGRDEAHELQTCQCGHVGRVGRQSAVATALCQKSQPGERAPAGAHGHHVDRAGRCADAWFEQRELHRKTAAGLEHIHEHTARHRSNAELAVLAPASSSSILRLTTWHTRRAGMEFAWNLPEVEHAIIKDKKDFKPSHIKLTGGLDAPRQQPLQHQQQERRGPYAFMHREEPHRRHDGRPPRPRAQRWHGPHDQPNHALAVRFTSDTETRLICNANPPNILDAAISWIGGEVKSHIMQAHLNDPERYTVEAFGRRQPIDDFLVQNSMKGGDGNIAFERQWTCKATGEVKKMYDMMFGSAVFVEEWAWPMDWWGDHRPVSVRRHVAPAYVIDMTPRAPHGWMSASARVSSRRQRGRRPRPFPGTARATDAQLLARRPAWPAQRPSWTVSAAPWSGGGTATEARAIASRRAIWRTRKGIRDCNPLPDRSIDVT